MSRQDENGHMLLFSSNEWYKELSHEEIQKVINQTKAWFDRLNAQGKVKAGQALARKGATVSGKNWRLPAAGRGNARRSHCNCTDQSRACLWHFNRNPTRD